MMAVACPGDAFNTRDHKHRCIGHAAVHVEQYGEDGYPRQFVADWSITALFAEACHALRPQAARLPPAVPSS